MVVSAGQPSTSRCRLLLCGTAWALLSFFAAGCGTVINLTSEPQNEGGFSQSTCYPMGGVTRALIHGGVWTTAGPTMAFAEGDTGENLLLASEYTAAGIGELVIDAPLSLVGDILTLPWAYANYQGKSYATRLLEAERKGAAPPEASDLPNAGAAFGNAHVHEPHNYGSQIREDAQRQP